MGDQVISTNIGVPQGGVLSPFLFNLVINPLLEEYELKQIDALAFADDVVFLARSKEELEEAFTLTRTWCQKTGISLNKDKSAVMNLRVDHRQRQIPQSDFDGIPLTTSYRYLGITVSDTG